MPIGDRLRQARERAGLTPERVDTIIDPTRISMSEKMRSPTRDVEDGNRPLQPGEIAAYARLYKVSPLWLSDGVFVHGNTKCESCGTRAGRLNRKGVRVEDTTGSTLCRECHNSNKGCLYYRMWIYSPDKRLPGSKENTVRIVRGHNNLHAAMKATVWARKFDRGAFIYDVQEGAKV